MPSKQNFDASPSVVQVYNTIYNRILAWEYLPGHKLSEQAVSDELGISRTPVREAFIRLVGEKLLEARPYRGTFVTQIDLALVEEAIFIRSCLEASVAELACEVQNQEFILAGKENILQQTQALQQKDFHRFNELDNAFHANLSMACNKPLTLQVIRSMNGQYYRMRNLLWNKPSLPYEHEQILAAIEKRDKKEAGQAMRSHITHLTDELAQVQQEYPEYFA